MNDTTKSIYQKHPASLAQVAQRIHFDPQSTAPIILSVSPCRSGTTILLRVFGASGVQAHFQQLKNILRWLLQGKEFSWKVPQQPTNRIFLKETLGPFTRTESQFNPLEALLNAGFPKEKLHVIIIGREPMVTWSSWYQFWKNKTCVDYFIDTYKTTEKIRQQVKELGISSSFLIYECFQQSPIDEVFQKLFKRLNIKYSSSTISGWDHFPAFGEPGSNIVLPKEPEPFITPGIHDPVEKASAFVFKLRQFDSSRLDQDDIKMIKTSGVLEIHQQWLEQCEQKLQI